MADLGIFFLIVVSMGVGFILAKLTLVAPLKTEPVKSLPWFNKRYYEGLTYLLNEEADEAIDRFIADMEINAETLEVHLALGGLLRRKGELGRAVRVHENLLATQFLSNQDKQQVQLELVTDYIASGLLDRAEQTLHVLLQQGSLTAELRREALKNLIEIYTDTKEWLKAIDVADQLTAGKFSVFADEWRIVQAHYACELADSALENELQTDARRWIKTALRYNKNCVRASLLSAKLDIKEEDYASAIAALKYIPTQDKQLASEMVIPLIHCYEKMGAPDLLQDELLIYLHAHKDCRALKLFYDLALRHSGQKFVITALMAVLNGFDHMHAAKEIVLALNQDLTDHNPVFDKFNAALKAALTVNTHYECVKCGFAGQHIHWMCPGCKSWGTVYMLL